MTAHHDDPLLRAIADANPVSEADFAPQPPLGPLPRRKQRQVVPAIAVTALAALAFVAFALTPASTPGGDELLKRAFSFQGPRSTILHWRVKTVEPGAGFDFTNELWMHITAAGVVDKVHDLRLDSAYKGLESVVEQPNGLGNPRGGVDRTRSGPDARIRTTKGMGYEEPSLASVIATALDAARGKLDVGAATKVRFDDRDAYEIRLREPTGANRFPNEVSVTLWLDRGTSAPLAVRWGEGDSLWRTMYVEAFETVPDNAENQKRLTFAISPN
jgi:hypothetical protein